MELKDYIDIILRRKAVIVATLLIAVIVTAIGTSLMTPSYSAAAKMRIATATSGAGGGERYDLVFTDRLMNTYIDIATSDAVMGPVSEIYGDVDPDSITVEVLANTELMVIAVEDQNPVRAAEIANSITEFLIAEGRRSRVSTASRSESVSVVTPASVPLEPSSPNLLLNLGLSAFLGLLGGLGLAFVFENTDTRLYTKEQIETALMAPAIGRIPSADRTGKQPGPFINMPMREAYRRLGANVVTLSRNSDMQVFIVTSAFPNEGKSTVTANLASTLARIGLKVIVIDCDLYKPSIHRIFNVSNHVGLTSVLSGKMPLSKSVYVKKPDGVHILASGPVGRRDQAPTPYPYDVVHRQDAVQLEQLGSPNMSNLMNELRNHYDIILIDTPPSLEITDSSVLAPLVDGMIVVVDRTQAHHLALEEIRQQFSDVSATVAGVVINRDSRDVRLRKELEQRRKPYYQAARKPTKNSPTPIFGSPAGPSETERNLPSNRQPSVHVTQQTKVVQAPPKMDMSTTVANGTHPNKNGAMPEGK